VRFKPARLADPSWLLDSPSLPGLPALAPLEEGDGRAGNPIVVATHPTLSGDMHGRVHVRHGVAFAGDALGWSNHHSL
jgi:hypothetical protein